MPARFINSMKKSKVLVFPCGSECGLEIGRSLRHQKEIELWGGSSVDDHGKFCFEHYIGNLPFIDSPDFLESLNRELTARQIDYIYPAMDSVIATLAQFEDQLAAETIGSSAETAKLALSKLQTYQLLEKEVRCPTVFQLDELSADDFPVFLKPEVGYGSRGTSVARCVGDIEQAFDKLGPLLILEYFPGEEYTVDCFTDFNGELRFVGPRVRRRVTKGISVNTISVPDDNQEFRSFANAINQSVKFNGAWFFQVKRTANGELGLLEIAPRIAGSMGLHRCKGVNLPLLSVFNQASVPTSPLENQYTIEFDRAFYNKVSISHQYSVLYVDFDDCLILNDEILNADLIKLIVQCRNKTKRIVLISRHAGDLENRLEQLGIRGLFHEVHHLRNGEPKSSVMTDKGGFLIDDSFRERLDASAIGIPSLGPESIEALLD